MKFGLEDSKSSKTLMATTTKLDKDEQEKSVDIKLYRSMIDSLLYLTAKPDIMFSVYLCARFQSCPKESPLDCGKTHYSIPLGHYWNGSMVSED